MNKLNLIKRNVTSRSIKKNERHKYSMNEIWLATKYIAKERYDISLQTSEELSCRRGSGLILYYPETGPESVN